MKKYVLFIIVIIGLITISLTSCGPKSIFRPIDAPVIGYIVARPLDETQIPVIDINGISMGTASFSTDWTLAHEFFLSLLRANYAKPILVLIKRQLPTIGNARTYVIIGTP